MAIRTILTEEDPVLKKKSREVVNFDEKLSDLLDDMIETLEEYNGVGLAAPQIGILRRVVLVSDDEGNCMELVNPKLISQSGSQIGLEGCLSVPGLWGDVDRPNEVTVEAQDRTGKVFRVSGTELVARCLCHELDHLEGILYSSYCDRVYTADELEERELENEPQPEPEPEPPSKKKLGRKKRKK